MVQKIHSIYFYSFEIIFLYQQFNLPGPDPAAFTHMSSSTDFGGDICVRVTGSGPTTESRKVIAEIFYFTCINHTRTFPPRALYLISSRACNCSLSSDLISRCYDFLGIATLFRFMCLPLFKLGLIRKREQQALCYPWRCSDYR